MNRPAGASADAGNYIYEGSALQFFNHAEGYIEPDGSGGYDYIYQYKDHLGNIRLAYHNSGTSSSPTLQIREENNYYPFGLKHKGYNGGQVGRNHKYGFGGKEEQDDAVGGNSLDWLDFGARNYDAALGRWFVLDPRADDILQVDLTPYNYSWNNPGNVYDPDGECPWCIGAVIGAVVDYASQVAVNYAQGKTGLDAFTDVDGTSILISAGAGALSGGLSTLKNVGKVGKATIQVGIEIAEESAQQLNENGNINGSDLATNVIQGKVIDKSLRDTRLFKEVSTKNAERKLDRAERVAGSNPRTSRQEAVTKAKKEVKSLENQNKAIDASNKLVDQSANKAVGAATTLMRGNNQSNIKVRDVRTQTTKVRDNTQVKIRRVAKLPI
ncbi:RHS repeat-associated core domain-containing protein [Flavobacteriaceae bacterium 3-367]